ncbi:hypothetical protein DB771_17210 [Burkholderia sp. AU29985]|nr:hypothetical protein XM57_19710 [Burkholderia cepacia]AYZ94745.1 hypothetical protein EGY28_06585 [Burkholderia dolosa]ETP63822.1 hypothetical protein BDSB_23430 [Burkholderia dolosa PC543]PRE56177.1 hypothetical protein C6P87_03575 [Burkholderia sp. AU12872]PUA75778.1 hypothetical protein DB771_17210 [Burkholderia sp. AU29985]
MTTSPSINAALADRPCAAATKRRAPAARRGEAAHRRQTSCLSRSGSCSAQPRATYRALRGRQRACGEAKARSSFDAVWAFAVKKERAEERAAETSMRAQSSA